MGGQDGEGERRVANGKVRGWARSEGCRWPSEGEAKVKLSVGPGSGSGSGRGVRSAQHTLKLCDEPWS